MVSITVDHISKAFGSTQALDNVSLQIEAGEIFFLLGPSGCGKTTLIRTLAGLVEPDRGSILFDQQDVTAAPPHTRQAAMVFQNYALWPHLNVAKNIAFGLEELKLSKDAIAERVDAMLELVQMEGYHERSINALSGGQQQRVALARALAVRPRCLLLDEPLSNLDAKLRLEMRSEIRRLCKDHGLTTIYVTHDQKEALSVADRIAVLEEGRLAQVGTPQEIYRRPRTCSVAEFIGECNFMGGMIQSTDGHSAHVHTDHGHVHAVITDPEWQPGPSELVIVGMRPESLALCSKPRGPNTIDGIVQEATYLGETAQYQFRASDGSILQISELNPGDLRHPDSGWMHAHASEKDVIVLQAPPGMVRTS